MSSAWHVGKGVLYQDHVVEILTFFPDLIDMNSDQEQADPWLIGLAIEMKATVITEETALDHSAVLNPNRKSKMKIPNVYQHFHIETMNLVQFINSHDWRSV